jgi:hypothetical protein
MLKGATPSALAMAGTAVFRMVVSSACMKNATATSQGKKRFTASIEMAEGTAATAASAGVLLAVGSNFLAMRGNYNCGNHSMRAIFFGNVTLHPSNIMLHPIIW